MPMTLNEMKVGMSDKVAQQIVDIFVRESEILELLPFDDAVSAQGGSTLTYGYVQKRLPSMAAFRALNTEYKANEAKVDKKYVDLKIFGGAFEIDRVLNQAKGVYNNMELQITEKVVAAIGTFHNAMINGDSAVDADSFDGLDKFLVGSVNEMNTDAVIDLSTMAKLKENADIFYEELVKLINRTKADALLVNEDMKSKIQTVARILGYKTESEEAFGRVVTTIGEGKVRLIDLGNIYTVAEGGETATETPIISVKERSVGGTSTAGITDIFAVHFDVASGFHGVTLEGTNVIHKYLPDFTAPNAVKKGEVEMVAAVALKNTRSAGVLRNIKVR